MLLLVDNVTASTAHQKEEEILGVNLLSREGNSQEGHRMLLAARTLLAIGRCIWKVFGRYF